jgi:hypothetical protein
MTHPLTELRDELTQTNRVTQLAQAILTELRAPGEYVVIIRVPPHRREAWPVTVSAPDGSERALELRRANAPLDTSPA